MHRNIYVVKIIIKNNYFRMVMLNEKNNNITIHDKQIITIFKNRFVLFNKLS